MTNLTSKPNDKRATVPTSPGQKRQTPDGAVAPSSAGHAKHAETPIHPAHVNSRNDNPANAGVGNKLMQEGLLDGNSKSALAPHYPAKPVIDE